jgi:hypothetical protein|tara:strand:- start:48 stop:2186 length:2139 start_codon:yes stop_codon:yes gene_type:complete
MPLVNFSNLDFNQIKTSLRDYLRANSNFTDYDFEGSNLSTIIDLLAYNTYINSYNANMVTNEVFIDSATLRENIVSLAKNIGYTPRPRRSAKALVSFAVDVSGTTTVAVTLKKGIVATTAATFGGQSFTFSIPEDITVGVNDSGLALFDSITIYEGVYIEESYNVNSRTPNQKYILNNSGIDTNLIRVNVQDSENSTIVRKFTQSKGLFDVKGDSPVFYLQEVDNERYEILFGDGIFGLPIQEPNVVKVGYIVSNGEGGNNLSRLSYSGQLVDNNGASITTNITTMFVDQQSYGGAQIESVESIKKYAPQIYSSQNRAVTAVDYEAMIPKIYPEAESVSAFGGEELTPPKFGRVLIAVKPINGVFLSSTIKNDISRQLKKYSVAGIIPEIVDLKYLYVETNSFVYYNENKAPSSTTITGACRNNINSYANSSELNKFGARFKYSKYQNVLDNSHVSITSNITTVNMRRDLQVVLNAFAEYEICFGNRFHIKNHGHGTHGGEIGFNIKSSGFKVAGITDTVYLGDSPDQSLKTGTMFLFKLNSDTEFVIVKQDVGTVDYVKGEIMLSPINIISTVVNRGEALIEISATPYSNDVIGKQDLYLQLDTSNVLINAVTDEIASGDDISGSNYIVTSSYSNGKLVRGKEILSSPSTISTTTTSNTSSTPIIQAENTVTVISGMDGTTTSTTTTYPSGSSSTSSPSSSSSSSGSSSGY